MEAMSTQLAIKPAANATASVPTKLAAEDAKSTASTKSVNMADYSFMDTDDLAVFVFLVFSFVLHNPVCRIGSAKFEQRTGSGCTG